MVKYDQERLLAIYYPLIVAFGFVCSVCTAIAWNHWKYVLDTCVNEINCGCILNGVSTITYFTGGHVAYCHWATFGLILPILVAIVFGCYHVFRVCFVSGSKRRRRREQHTVRQRYTFFDNEIKIKKMKLIESILLAQIVRHNCDDGTLGSGQSRQ